MKIKNNTGISLPLAVWVAIDDYDYDSRDNVISATTLLKPIRQIVLGRKYKDSNKEVDVVDLIASKMGTAIHDSVEKAWSKKDKVIKTLENMGYKNSDKIFDALTMEKRSELQIGDYIISGKFDVVFNGIVCDVKSTSTWTYIFGSKDDDYIKQMSIYKLLNPELITSDYGYIEFIFTDWSMFKARADKQYPQARTASKKLKLMSKEETLKLVTEKLDEVSKYEKLDDSKLPYCTDEELWLEPTKWKYYKNPSNIKRATKVFDNLEDAEERLSKDGNVGLVVEFKGKAKRCKYCNYTNLCNQYYELKAKGLVEE